MKLTSIPNRADKTATLWPGLPIIWLSMLITVSRIDFESCTHEYGSPTDASSAKILARHLYYHRPETICHADTSAGVACTKIHSKAGVSAERSGHSHLQLDKTVMLHCTPDGLCSNHRKELRSTFCHGLWSTVYRAVRRSPRQDRMRKRMENGGQAHQGC